jgi:glycosyltransferase involved in cell wall biosynthesis
MSLRMIFLIIYSKLFGKKLVIWWGGTQDSERNIAKYKLIYRKIITHLSDGYILYSKLAEEYLRSLNRNIRKVLILGNNTFDSSRYYEQIMNLQSVRKKGSKLTIMTVGFLIPRKNIMTLLEAYAKLKKAFRNIRLIIIGNGPELSKLKAYCLEHKLEEVDFKGFIPHKEMLLQYAEADIYVHPALFDQWPQTYNEAASSGLPIVISRSSGVHNEYIEQYKDNVLFDSTDETQLERKLSKVIANDALRKELGDKALEDALKNDCKTASEKVKRFLFSFE